MIYTFIAKNIYRILVLVVAVVALWLLVSAIRSKPEAEARLAKNQAQAASQSGSDAVNAVGKAGEREAEAADLTRANEVEIRNAEGADVSVAAPVDAAGLRALCRRDSYRNHPRCLQRADP